jgi:hypothetical protein
MGGRRLVWDAAEPPTVKADWVGFPTSFLFLSPQEKKREDEAAGREATTQ